MISARVGRTRACPGAVRSGAGSGACSLYRRRHLALFNVMLAEQARLEGGSVQACHEAVNDGEGLVYQW